MTAGLSTISICLLGLVAGAGALAGEAAPEEHITSFRMAYSFEVTGSTPWARVIVIVPRTIEGRQRVYGIELDPKPLRVFEADGIRYSEFFFPKPEKTFQVEVRGVAKILEHDLARARKAAARPDPAFDPAPYLLDEPNMEKDNPAIVEAASGLEGKDELDTVGKIYAFVKETLRYGGYDPGSKGAVRALQEKKGDCTEFADLMTALCRARSIPARHVMGLLARPGVKVPQHSWVEVHTKDFGWVPFDPIVDAVSRTASFEKLRPWYLILSTLRNDEMIDNGTFILFRWWGDRIRLASEKYEVQPAKLPTAEL